MLQNKCNHRYLNYANLNTFSLNGSNKTIKDLDTEIYISNILLEDGNLILSESNSYLILEKMIILKLLLTEDNNFFTSENDKYIVLE